MDLDSLIDWKLLTVKPGTKVKLAKDFDPTYTAGLVKPAVKAELPRVIENMSELHERLYAEKSRSLLLIFQAMDAAGKDGTIRNVTSGLNPQGCQVTAFAAPSTEELAHDYLWRIVRALPERGRVGIFNRSHYEEVLVARIHPKLIESQRLPPETLGKGLWKMRFEHINNFERYLVENGTYILKFFLNVSKAEQRRRFLNRIDRPDKNWKFNMGDIRDREHWDDYHKAYEDVFEATSTKWAPWYVIPADHKWFTHLAVAHIIYKKLQELDPQIPKVGEDVRAQLLEARKKLEAETTP